MTAESQRHRLPLSLIVIVFLITCLDSELCAAPTALTKTQNLNFGTVVGGGALSGTVSVDTSGARAVTGSVTVLGTAFSPAGFTLTGTGGKSYTLTPPSQFTISNGAVQMTVTGITTSIPLTGVIPAGGSLPFLVGGTLTVNSAQQNSLYTGTFSITVK